MIRMRSTGERTPPLRFGPVQRIFLGKKSVERGGSRVEKRCMRRNPHTQDAVSRCSLSPGPMSIGHTHRHTHSSSIPRISATYSLRWLFSVTYTLRIAPSAACSSSLWSVSHDTFVWNPPSLPPSALPAVSPALCATQSNAFPCLSVPLSVRLSFCLFLSPPLSLSL